MTIKRAAQNHAEQAFFLPDEGIPPLQNIQVAIVRHGQDRIARITLPGDQIFASMGKPLFGMRMRVMFRTDAGIEKLRFSIDDDDVTGKAMRFTGGFIREEGVWQVFPAEQIAAAQMAPVNRSPCRLERIMLIKKMVPAIVPDKTVWIIHPVVRRHGMEPGAQITHVLAPLLSNRLACRQPAGQAP